MNYAELCANIEQVTENTFAAESLALFTQLAEQVIYNTVQLPALRKNVVGVMSANNKYLQCPTDFLSVYSLAAIDPVTGDYTYMLNKDANFIREAYPSATTAGLPKYYALFGPRSDLNTELTFIMGPMPDKAYQAELHYFFYPESIVTAGTSWLGDNFDSALLNGCLVEAARFMKSEADIVALYQQHFTQSVALLKNLGDGKQRGDAYRDGQMKIKVS